MKLVKVGAAVLNQTPMDWAGNQRRILEAMAAAREAKVSILCLPELCLTGYGCEDAFHSPGVHATALDLLAEIAPASAGMAACVGLPLQHRKALYNVAALLVDGAVVGFAAKRFLAGDGLHYEPRWFKPWPRGARDHFDLGDCEVPIGDLVFEIGGVNLGFEICEDAWVAERPGSELALEGVDVILNPSASHFAFEKHDVRKRFVIEGSRAFRVAYLYANLLGNEAGRVIYDGGALIASGGDLVAAGPRFSFRDWNLTTAVVDIEANRMQQARTGSYRPRLGDSAVEVEFQYPARVPEAPAPSPASWEGGGAVKEEEFARAVGLGLFDYMRKSRSRGFVVSLSGGADSAAVSCLVAGMVELAIEELGFDGLRAKLEHVPALRELAASGDRQTEVHGVVAALLTCVYQSTRNSSDVTRNAARAVAQGLGAQFFELDVDSLVGQYTALVSGALGRALSWETDDLALQNIQARVRGPGVWMLANVRGALLLATSNRSEAAVGYATMDGDTCGGLSPIAGIDKAFLRRWLAWRERRLPALAAVNAQQPTAELRPLGAGQTDEQDLMPYDLLDAIEGAAIRDKLTPLETFLQMRVRFPELGAGQLCVYVERFFRLWCRNQWKRERYAPSFHVDDKNLDPKTWCRFPILSGGFERELAELRAYVERC